LKRIIGIAILAAVSLTGGLVSAAPHKLRVDDPALVRTLADRGGKVIGDYGSFTVLEADDALLAGVNSNHLEVADDWNLIRLNAREMDTSAPQVKALRKTRGAFSGRNLHLVQFAGPVKTEWLEALKRSGARIVSYIPENAYLIYGDAASLARMQSWAGNSAFVQWEGEYGRELKVHPDARLTSNAGQPEVRTFVVQLMEDADANAATVALIDKLKGSAVRRDVSGIAPYRNIMVSLRTDQLDSVASQPDVISIQPYNIPKKRDERQDQILAGQLNGNVPTGPGYLAFLASKGFTQSQFDASGFVVDVADSGIDNGSTTPGHFGLYQLGDTGQNSRVAYIHANNSSEGFFAPGGTTAGCDGHGTLNTHIIANYDNFGGFQHQDAEGFSYGDGVCPFVQVGSSVIFDNSSDADYTFPDFTNMVADAYNGGARVSNNSWGSDAGGAYDSTSQAYDFLVRDADKGGNHEMVIVFAAGNAGPCVSGTTLGIDSPGSAKNVITVGASENVRSLSIENGGNDPKGNDACAESDLTADNANSVSCSSSRGPCKDGRMKPDLMAPGVHITGGAPQQTIPDPNGLGLALDCFNALGVCALPNSGTTQNTNNFFPLGQEFYTESSGTSHSTPAVSGACAVIRQYFINQGWTPPSAAMTKAFLINSARYMTGISASDNLWSGTQGMGEVNLGVALDGVPRVLRDELPGDMFTGTGQIRAFVGHVSDTSKPFRVTVAWTDAPGSTAAAAYNNNLDLTVSVGVNTYKGNVFSKSNSITGGTADRRNNVESVFLPAGTGGDFVVTITAANINSKGVPTAGSPLNQDFALVIYNGTATNAAVYTPVAASYSGLFYEPGNPEVGKSGAVTLTTTTSRSYTGKLQIGAASSSFSGAFTVVGTATNIISRKGASPLGLMLTANLTNSDVITGTVSDGSTFTADLLANRTVSKSTGVPAFAGNYTLIIGGTNNDSQLPGGDGSGTVNVSTLGKIKLAATLADGTKFSQSTVASTDGQWALYASLYSGQGQILGWLQLTNPPQGGVGGLVDWIKPQIAAATFYPLGFNFETVVTGSAYDAAASPVIGFANGMVVFSGGNVANPFTNNVSISGSAIKNLSANKLTMKFNASKGSFTGSVVDPFTSISMPFSGVYLQNEGFGLGNFLGTNQSGSVFFGN
jgi:hypothetical protein